MIDKIVLKISSNEDIKNINYDNEFKINHLHIEISNISEINLKNLLEKLSKLEPYNRFHLDIKNSKINDETCKLLSNFISRWNLREINYNFSGTCFTDKQFEILFSNALLSDNIKVSLEKLHLILENVELNTNKLKTINNVLNSLLKLNHIFINIRKNKIDNYDITELTKTLQKFYSREIHF